MLGMSTCVAAVFRRRLSISSLSPVFTGNIPDSCLRTSHEKQCHKKEFQKFSTFSMALAAPSSALADKKKKYLDKSAVNNGRNEGKGEGEILYLRAPNRLTFPRTILATTTIHTSYWLWYVLDFTPQMNAAAAAKNETLDLASGAAVAVAGIDPAVGYVGLGLAIMMSLASCAYPLHLISEVRTGKEPGSLSASVHSLPFFTPQYGGNNAAVYAPGELTIDSPLDVENIFKKHGGDLKKQRGFLALRAEGKRSNLLLNIGSDDEVFSPLFLDSLLPHGLGKLKVDTSMPERGKRKKRSMNPRKRRREERQLLRRRQ